MRKTVIAILALMTAFAVFCGGALAELNLAGVRATPIQNLALRTGPGAQYGELYMMPSSTAITVLELEEGNGVTWALMEFMKDGKRVRAYTGLKRMTLAGSVPYARHAHLSRRLVNSVDVYDAPDYSAGVRGWLSKGTTVDFLGFEGDFCFIEWTSGGTPNRGYIYSYGFWVDQYSYAEYFPLTNDDTWYAVDWICPMYSEPSDRSGVLFNIPFDACVTVNYDELISAPDGWIPLYYGGLKGYGRDDQFCDLRFDSPESAKQFMN